ncbi:MBL fold metallo-hydrolase [Kurthia sibirica]|uniref:MBL fold metallo-hydrolase n=1 Tax=Kurthia sibirica TaxID=202750 RepID=A0A2U3ALF2_9BACL|nr:MBL fold metallo-hydrolase [Kurthia sibirica]PWI25363.1 MBL fold metallo-hydrolase [Kurthia sibirica]GEK34621.1 hydrolase [Kurthia sibirica]
MIKRIHTPTTLSVIGHVNCYLLKGDALSIVDTGTRTVETLVIIEEMLKEEGYKLSDIEQVILTHHHPDHIGWTDAFENAEMLGHEYLVNWLNPSGELTQQYDAFYEENMLLNGVPRKLLSHGTDGKRLLDFFGKKQLSHILYDGDRLPGHEDFVVMETLGHAQSHHVFWNDKADLLIGGDLIMYPAESIPSFEPPLHPKGPREKSIIQYNNSLEKVRALPIKTNYAGHGDAIHNMTDLITERLQMQSARSKRFLPLIAKYGPIHVFDLSALLFPTRYMNNMSITLCHTLAHVDYLVSVDLIIEKLGEQGIIYYEITTK